MFYNVYFADLKRRVCQCLGGAGAGLLVFSVECINDKTIKCVCNTCEQWRSMLRTGSQGGHWWHSEPSRLKRAILQRTVAPQHAEHRALNRDARRQFYLILLWRECHRSSWASFTWTVDGFTSFHAPLGECVRVRLHQRWHWGFFHRCEARWRGRWRFVRRREVNPTKRWPRLLARCWCLKVPF